VGLLPKKNTPQEWEDIVLPIFEQPEESKPRERSKKQQDDDTKISYRRQSRTSKGVPCQDCAEENQAGGGAGITNASYVRIEGTTQRLLCYRHKSDWHNRDLLNGSVQR